jgi:crotonobetainyl-CoA:carnitine CoA-transferase CaiB-like acyl-CoA transferase
MSRGALDGLVILDLTRVLAGPLSTMLLGDMGAEVIKIERPGTGDDTRAWGPPFVGGESAYYLGVNRNKRSLTLDLSTEEGRGILRRLVPLADVVIDNFKMGTLERWGLDDDWFSQHAPRVVRCTISGYGSTGPKAGMPGYDFILQAESGLMSITGEPDGASMKLGVAIVDICTGLLATISVLAALTARQSTGQGQRTEVNLHDTGLLMLANVAANYLASGEMPGRHGNAHPNIVPYRTFRASDGEVAVAVGNDDQFRKLAALLDSPEWADDARLARNRDRVEHRDLIDGLIQQKFGARTRSEWIEALDQVGIPSGPINNVAEALSASQTQARDMVTEVDHPLVGLVRMLGLPIRFDRTPATIRSHPPGLGEHTSEILGDMLGMERSEIEDLRAGGVV